MNDTKIETLPEFKTLIDFALPHFAHKDFNPDKPEAVLTLYVGAMRLIFAHAAFGKLYIDGKTGDYTDDPALFSIAAAADNTSALLTVPKNKERILCSADWQVQNIDSAEHSGTLRVTETLTYRVAKTKYTPAGNSYAGVAVAHDHQEIERTPHQLGAAFFRAAMTLLDEESQKSVRKYMANNKITEPALDLVH